MIDLRNTHSTSSRKITHFRTKVLSHEEGRWAAGLASRVTHLSMNDIQCPSFHRDNHVSNFSLSEILRKTIYKEVIFNQLRSVRKNYPPQNEGFPPFSLFREFLAWIISACKQCLIIGNQNAITYKEVFPYLMANKLWLGATGFASDMVFGVPKGSEVDPKDKAKAARLGYIGDFTRLGNSCWFTNIDHGRRHQPMKLMTMQDNIRYCKHKDIRENGYQRYFHYGFIDVPYTDSIPSDYNEIMGVPITFLDKYCPEQFDIQGISLSYATIKPKNLPKSQQGGPAFYIEKNGIYNRLYARILIRKKQ